MNIFLGILLGIIVLMTVVTIHEFGHFIVAKRNGVKVNEFGIGFPPKAKAWLHIPVKEAEKYCKKFKYEEKLAEKIKNKAAKKLKSQKKGTTKWIWIPLKKSEWYKETEEGLELKEQDYLIFSLNYLPIGGFCQMDGESNIDTRKGTFGASSFWSKTKILFAGVGMNWLLAFAILTGLAFTGMPELLEGQFRIESDTTYLEKSMVVINEVKEDTPAAKAGIKKDDIILNGIYDGELSDFTSYSDLQKFNKKHAGEDVTYTIKREDKESEVKTKLNPENSDIILGVSMYNTGNTLYRSTWSAPIVGATTTVQITTETFKGLGTLVYNIFTGIGDQLSNNNEVREAGKAKISSAGDSVSGPVGIIGVIFPAIAQTGIANVLYLIALISVSLACMNVLPIPALDGGRWLLIAIFKLLRKPLNPEKEAKVVSATFIALLALSVLVTVLDVFKIIG